MLIGLSGLIGSGKNTAARLIQQEFPEYDFQTLSFAKTLKDAVSVMFGWERSLLEGDTNESRLFRTTEDKFWSKKLGFKVTPRLILQKFGNDAKNYFCEDFWVASGVQRLVEQNNDKNYIVTDVRYQDEIAFLKAENAVLFEIERGRPPEWYYDAKRLNNGNGSLEDYPVLKTVHVSEWKWIGLIPNKIYNNGTLEDFRNNLRSVLKNFVRS